MSLAKKKIQEFKDQRLELGSKLIDKMIEDFVDNADVHECGVESFIWCAGKDDDEWKKNIDLIWMLGVDVCENELGLKFDWQTWDDGTIEVTFSGA